MKPIFISGIKPSGQLHVGNYLGALKYFVDLQNSGEYDCYCFIADLHAITEPQDPRDLTHSIFDVAASYIAVGLDPEKITFFLQSLVPAHSELAWILNTIAPMGELERMTQYKDKSTRQKENVNVGLFDYPVLMAADILLYDPQTIPVGDDQLQHLELTRTLARKFNARFGKTFVEPKGLLTKTPRVMSLKDPAKKMSKSQPEGCLFLDDSPEETKANIARAVTDSDAKIEYDPERKPGLSNLIEIYASLTHMEPHLIAKEFSGEPYSALKKRLTEVVTGYFAEFREKKKILLAKPTALVTILKDGSFAASKVADKKMAEVRKKVGLAI